MHAAFDEQVGAAPDDGFLQLEVGDPVDQQAADPVVAVVDVDLIAEAAQLLGGRHPAGARADDPDGLRPLGPGLRRLDPAVAERGIGDVALHRADGDRLETLLDHAVAFAEAVLRADAAADLRHVVGRRRDLVGFFQPPLGRQHQPVGDVVRDRAVNLTEGHPALGAAGGLVGRRLGAEVVVDLAPVAAAQRRRALLRMLLLKRHELEHVCAHVLSPWRLAVGAGLPRTLRLRLRPTIAASRQACHAIRRQ